MRIPKTWVSLLSKKVADNITSKGLVKPTVDMDKFLFNVEEIITEELMVEDRLNDEVRGILKQHESDIERGRMDYRKIFDLTKHKLVKERNLVL
ncbi:MAG: hypothetical protein A2X59_00345 [Nitrospirae bacterium GWC2_42_7]|nr:MAG: hypothetical protein A2X59_00345 [Nitrospirae bacterium GWC2_42_7]